VQQLKASSARNTVMLLTSIPASFGGAARVSLVVTNAALVRRPGKEGCKAEARETVTPTTLR